MKNSFYNVQFQKMYYLLKASAKQNVIVVVLQVQIILLISWTLLRRIVLYCIVYTCTQVFTVILKGLPERF